MNIHWFPGHMKKTKDLLREQLKLIDVVFELLDARIPSSSQNPLIDEILGGKPRIIILNKYDLADPLITKEWVKHYLSNNIRAVPVNSITGEGLDKVMTLGEKILDEKNKSLEARGRKRGVIRVMIVGIPNVGKSTLINRLVGRRSAKTGDRPGVTRGKQWIRLKNNMELLDTPGILWPKFDDKELALNLAFTGAIKDDLIDIESLAFKLLERLLEDNKKGLMERYKFASNLLDPLEIMNDIARKRGCIISGGEIDYTRVAVIILNEFRQGKIANISLESPPIN